MGWLVDALFGKAQPGNLSSGSLPKAVEQWQRTEPSADVTSQADSTVQQAGSRRQVVMPVEEPTKGDPFHDQSGRKIVPEVEIEHIEAHESDDRKHLELWAHLKNHSVFEVEVTRVNCLRQHIEPKRFMRPGEVHEVRIYQGGMPKNDAEHKCEVQYKLCDNGDYFQADHVIRYHYERDDDGEYYLPERIELIRPIRDI